MNTPPNYTPDPQDLEFFDDIVELVKRIYVLHGSLEPLAAIERTNPESGEKQTLYMEAETPLETREDKTKFIAQIQHAGLTVDSKRSIVILESWAMLNSSSEAIKQLNEIRARGGSISEHPDHIEAVAIHLESDAGFITHTFQINRHHQEMVELTPADERTFYSRDDPETEIEGTLTGFHIPTVARKTEKGLAYARLLAATFHTETAPLPDPPIKSKSN